MAITCPICNFTSGHPRDEEEGYCGHCHAFTSASCPHSPEVLALNPDGRCIICLHWPEEHPREREIPKPNLTQMWQRVEEILATARADAEEMME